MALDRWIAIFLVLISLIYGYTAFFTMDAGLPPFMKRNPIWPSTFPKILSVLAIATSLVIIFSKSGEKAPEDMDINYRRLGDYHIGQALMLLGLMVMYALALRPVGFLISTVSFLCLGGWLLGEKRHVVLVAVALIASVSIWYLVQQVLGIYLRPWPMFLGN